MDSVMLNHYFPKTNILFSLLSKLTVSLLAYLLVKITYTVTGKPPVIIEINLYHLEYDNLILYFDSLT